MMRSAASNFSQLFLCSLLFVGACATEGAGIESKWGPEDWVDAWRPAGTVWGKIPREPKQADLELLRSEEAREQDAQVDAETLASIVDGNNDLGFDLLRHWAGKKPDTAVAPASIHQAMGMVLGASGGKTRDALLAGMGYSKTAEQTHAALNTIQMQLAWLEERENESFKLQITNGVFMRPEYSPTSEYLDTLASHYGTGVYQMDKSPQTTIRKVNEWVAENTNGLIKRLLNDNAIGERTLWAFVNAIYLKAPFAPDVFPKSRTEPGTFRGASGSSVSIPMMHGLQKGAYYGETVDFRWGMLPLGIGQDLSTLWVLPEEGKLDDVVAGLNSESFRRWSRKGVRCRLPIVLPKFKLETGSVRIGKFLVDRGLGSLFGHEAEPEFPGLGQDAQSQTVTLGRVVHSVVFAVDESGVEAAGTTAMTGDTSAGPGAKPKPKYCEKLVFDRPFLFMVFDRRTGLILFTGQVSELEGK